MTPKHWRRSSAGRYLRHLPRIKHLRGTWLHRKVGDRLFHREMWQPDRNRFAAGLSLGVFMGMIPLPVQMIAAAMLAFMTRVNIPAAIAGTWLSNPITTPLFIYGQYKLGVFLLGKLGLFVKPGQKELSEKHATDLFQTLTHAPIPLLVGASIFAVVGAMVTYPIALWGWDWFHRKFKKKETPPATSEETKAENVETTVEK